MLFRKMQFLIQNYHIDEILLSPILEGGKKQGDLLIALKTSLSQLQLWKTSLRTCSFRVYLPDKYGGFMFYFGTLWFTNVKKILNHMFNSCVRHKLHVMI